MMKSPNPRIRRHDSPFSKEAEIWVIKQSASLTASQFQRPSQESMLAMNGITNYSSSRQKASKLEEGADSKVVISKQNAFGS